MEQLEVADNSIQEALVALGLDSLEDLTFAFANLKEAQEAEVEVGCPAIAWAWLKVARLASSPQGAATSGRRVWAANMKEELNMLQTAHQERAIMRKVLSMPSKLRSNQALNFAGDEDRRKKAASMCLKEIKLHGTRSVKWQGLFSPGPDESACLDSLQQVVMSFERASQCDSTFAHGGGG